MSSASGSSASAPQAIQFTMGTTDADDTKEAPLDTLLAQAEDELIRGDPMLAVDTLRQAVQLDPKNTSVYDLLGEALTECDRIPEAIQAYQTSARLAPRGNSSTWLALAQLQSGAESLASFRAGVSILQAECKQLEQAFLSKAAGSSQAAPSAAHLMKVPEIKALKRTMCAAYCSMAELCVTDLCDEPTAEKDCEAFLQAAVGSDASSPEGFGGLVNLRLIQGRREDAAKYLKHCLKLIEQASNPSATGDADDGDDLPYKFKLDTAKSCLELGQHDAALQLAEACLNENDSFCESWLVGGMAAFHLGDNNTAAQYVLGAEKTISKEQVHLKAPLADLRAKVEKAAGSDVFDSAKVGMDEEEVE